MAELRRYGGCKYWERIWFSRPAVKDGKHAISNYFSNVVPGHIPTTDVDEDKMDIGFDGGENNFGGDNPSILCRNRICVRKLVTKMKILGREKNERTGK